MTSLDRLAFVDLETSGLSPTSDRITEIGVVTVDGDEVNEWTTLVNPGRRIPRESRFYNGIDQHAVANAPRFGDIADGLFERLQNRLFIAHNARFDFSFLKAEFQRVGLFFEPQVLCSVMLSRQLYPEFAHHDLDTLMERHGLASVVRHRALPDAQLLLQFWKVIQSNHDKEDIRSAIDGLLAGPVLPAHLDPSLIDKLPEASGVFVLHGDDGTVLHFGKAGNLKRHVLNYFRVDRISRKALGVSHLVENITWRETRGNIGAHLQFGTLESISASTQKRRVAAQAAYSWRLVPESQPCVELIRLSARTKEDDCYGLFNSEKKACNALARLALQNNLCQAALGITDALLMTCTGCVVRETCNCATKAARLKQLTKIMMALKPLRIPHWPYRGPIAIKERSDFHILEDWRYLGTAQSEKEVHDVLETRIGEFDEPTFSFLAKTLPRLPKRRIVQLQRRSSHR